LNPPELTPLNRCDIAAKMDVFGTTVTVIQEIYTITVFIRGVVTDVKNYDADRDDIAVKIEHEYLFLESFKGLFFDDDGALMANAQLPTNLKRDVENNLKALKGCLAEDGLLAVKYGILIDTDGNGETQPSIADTSKTGAGEHSISLARRIKSKVLDLKKKAVDWALFDKDKLLKLLVEYSQWTERLRQTMSLMLLVSAVFGNKRVTEFASSKTAKDLGLRNVAKRQLLAKSSPPDKYKALSGTIVEGSIKAVGETTLENTEALSGTVVESSATQVDLQIADYQDEWAKSVKVVVEYREYSSALLQAVTLQKTKEIEALKAPMKNLAWFLHNASFVDTHGPNSSDIDDQDMFTLLCLGYLDLPDEYRMAFIYQIPQSTINISKDIQALTLHGLINKIDSNSASSKPALEQRFFIAHALGKTILSIHESGWVHKNISSRGVAVFPGTMSQGAARGTGSAGGHAFIPYLTDWGYARLDLGATDLLDDFEAEPNFYRHPIRQGHPNTAFTKEHDLYSLGVVLLEIGVWKTISKLFATQIKLVTERKQLPPRDTVRKWLLDIAKNDLPKEMGNTYTGAVLACLNGDFGVGPDDKHKTGLSMAFRSKVVDVIAAGLIL
jgi:serine/threonine protein kinase